MRLPAGAALWLSVGMTAASATEVTFSFEDVLSVREREVPYALDIRLAPTGATRVEVDALMDLRELQQRVEDDIAGRELIDVCGNRTVLKSVAVETEGQVVGLSGDVESQFYECRRSGDRDWQREGKKQLLSLGFSASATAYIDDNCAIFELVDLTLVPEARAGIEDEDPDLLAARILMLEAVNVLLRRDALCPELPPELVSLDPDYEEGGPREIGDGGLGIQLRGTVDVSTGTIIDLLRVLQADGLLPGPP